MIQWELVTNRRTYRRRKSLSDGNFYACDFFMTWRTSFRAAYIAKFTTIAFHICGLVDVLEKVKNIENIQIFTGKRELTDPQAFFFDKSSHLMTPVFGEGGNQRCFLGFRHRTFFTVGEVLLEVHENVHLFAAHSILTSLPITYKLRVKGGSPELDRPQEKWLAKPAIIYGR